MHPVDYINSGYSANRNVEVMRAYYTGSTALQRGGVLVFDEEGSNFNNFSKGPGVDVSLAGGANNSKFAGIVADESVGSTGGWIDILVPKAGSVLWVRCDSNVSSGNGLNMQASGTDQGLSDTTAGYSSGDLARALMTRDASNNPYSSDNLVPALFHPTA